MFLLFIIINCIDHWNFHTGSDVYEEMRETSNSKISPLNNIPNIGKIPTTFERNYEITLMLIVYTKCYLELIIRKRFKNKVRKYQRTHNLNNS